MRRGEVWLVNLDPTIGAEIKKTRPVVVVNEAVRGYRSWHKYHRTSQCRRCCHSMRLQLQYLTVWWLSGCR
jgi:hypothetical protein